MKINVIGGGPAGLYFAILMKLSDPQHQIQVFERNPKDNTFGWGVVFSDKTMSYLQEPDPATHQLILKELRTWENVDIVHRGVLTSVGGNRFSGIARLGLLQALQERCGQLDIKITYGQEMTDIPPADLVVAADGVASRLRTRYRHLFRPTRVLGSNRYIWYGTAQPFQGLTLTFRPYQDGLYMAHSYKYSQDLSTFIVEVDEPTWHRLRRLPEPKARQRLEKVFAEDLGGHPLLSNRSRWIRFVTVRNQHWWARVGKTPVVLLGDALATAHFSIGSGTKLAMEESIALWQAFQQHHSPELALAAFEASCRPKVEKIQALAGTSQKWFEEARNLVTLETLPFAYEAMTRSSAVNDSSLERRDPAFVQAYREWQRSHQGES